MQKSIGILLSLVLGVSCLAADSLPVQIGKESPKGLSFSNVDVNPDVEAKDHLSVVAVGDVLLHKPLQVQAYQSADGHRSLWKKLLGLISSADMSYANLEGPVAPGLGRGGHPTADPGERFDDNVHTSYPMFNYHESLVEDLVESGIDVVSTANNHALDRGSLGVDKTIEVLNKNHLQYTGSRTAAAAARGDNDWTTVVDRNDFKVAWISCSFSTNGIPDQRHQVLNCFDDRESILKSIQELSQDRGIDAVMVAPHVGIEYQDLPESRAVVLYRSFIEAGALAVFGAHPHVLQPWEKFKSSDGREGFIVYSLGNFVSGQFQKVKTRATIFLTLDLVRNRFGKTQISQVQYIPLEMTRTAGEYSVVPISAQSGTREIYNHIIGMFGTSNLLTPNQLGPQTFSKLP